MVNQSRHRSNKRSSWWLPTSIFCLLALSVASAVPASASTSPSRSQVHVTKAKPLTALPGVGEVQTWIAGAATTKSLPSSLQSQLSAEPDSMFVADPCVTQPGNPSSAKPCSFGDLSAQETVVLDGDSFSEELIPALDLLGKQDHFKLLVFARLGCPFADIPIEDWEGSLDSGCLPFEANAIKAINAMTPQPSLVLLAQEYENQAPGEGYGSISLSQWTKATSEALGKFKIPQVPIGVILGFPEAAETPDQCLSVHESDIDQCSTPDSTALRDSVDLATATAVEEAHAQVVDVSALFCGNNCPDVVHGDFVFSNQWHLNQAYVESIATAFGSLVGCIGARTTIRNPSSLALLGELLPNQKSQTVRAACAQAVSSPYNL